MTGGTREPCEDAERRAEFGTALLVECPELDRAVENRLVTKG